MRVRAVGSFIWKGRGVDVGDLLDVPPHEAHVLVHGYRYCVPAEDEPPASGGVPGMVAGHADPVPQHTDPKPRRRR